MRTESYRVMVRQRQGIVSEADNYVAGTEVEIKAILTKMRASPYWKGCKLWAERLVYVSGVLHDVQVVEEKT